MCSWDAGSPLPIAADRQLSPYKPKVILTLFVAQLIDVELNQLTATVACNSMFPLQLDS